MVNNIDTVFLTVTFLLPGFIIFYVKSMLVPQRIVNSSSHIFRYFFYSSINMFIAIPAIHYINSKGLYKEYPYIVIFSWLFMIIVIPILIGVILGIISSRGIDKRCLDKLCPTTIGSIPTAWDYKFSKTQNRRFVSVKLKDGSIIRGLYSDQSYASSYQEERDIYLEILYGVDENDNWIHIEGSDGILLKASEIVAIDFRKVDEDNKQDNPTENYQEIIDILKNIEAGIEQIKVK